MNLNHDKDSKAVKKSFRNRKKEKTRKTILNEAERLFYEKSYRDVLLEDIAEAAFVSRATLYNYFKNKDEVFFAVGYRLVKQENESIITSLPVELSGRDQILFLCEKTLKDLGRNLILFKHTRKYFERINDKNSPFQKINYYIIEKLGPSTIFEFDENQSPIKNLNLEEEFDYPNYVKYVIEVFRNGNFWGKAIRKGKEDKSIKNTLEEFNIGHYLSMFMSGIVHEIELRKFVMDQMGFTRDMIISQTLDLIALFLDGKKSS